MPLMRREVGRAARCDAHEVRGIYDSDSSMLGGVQRIPPLATSSRQRSRTPTPGAAEANRNDAGVTLSLGFVF
jgi:hypothetical protein